MTSRKVEDDISRSNQSQDESVTPQCVSSSRSEKYDKDAATTKLESGGESYNAEAEFPFLGVMQHNSIYGNYIVASKDIEPGEMILYEAPILVSPCSFSNHPVPVCLSCYKAITLDDRCSKCNWSVCGPDCEENEVHKSNECEILSRNSVEPLGCSGDYFCVETLRCLLFRESAPEKWKRIQTFESHVTARAKNIKEQKTLQFITNFIRLSCKLEEYDDEVIDHVVGVLNVNTFCAFNNLKKYSSVLFDRVSLITHDCSPNALQMMVNPRAEKRDKVLLNDQELLPLQSSISSDYYFSSDSEIAMKIYAIRAIKKSEIISIRYVDVDLPLSQRRAKLKNNFYFACTCSKCLIQLTQETIAFYEASCNLDYNETRKWTILLYGTFFYFGAMFLAFPFLFWAVCFFLY